MFRISFEVRDMVDLSDQVNKLIDTINDEVSASVPISDYPIDTEPLEPGMMTAAQTDKAKAFLKENDIPKSLDPVLVPTPIASPIVAQPPAVVEAPSPAPINTAVSGTIDADGIPWDARIHSSVKTRTTKDVWKKKRGVNAALVEQVEAELIGKPAGLTPAPAALAPPAVNLPPVAVNLPPVAVNPAPVAAAPTVLVTAPGLGVTTPVAVPSPTPQPADMKPAHSLVTFKANIAQVVALLINQQKITQEYVSQLNTYFKVGELFEIFNNDEQVSQLFDNFCQLGLITKVG